MAIKGKKAEPTREELEFIYSRLEKLSDRAILEDMEEDTKFSRRSLGFITRRRKEFAAAKTVLEELVKKEFDPVLAQRKKEHWYDLAETARKLSLNLECYSPSEVIKPYITYDPRGMGGLEEDIDDYLGTCLLSHLKAEFPELFSMDTWQEIYEQENKRQLFETLKLVANRRTFEGKCDICKDWQK